MTKLRTKFYTWLLKRIARAMGMNIYLVRSTAAKIEDSILIGTPQSADYILDHLKLGLEYKNQARKPSKETTH